MTIVISAGYAAAIGGDANNPHILWDDLGVTGTWSTGNGTEIEPASLLSTGTTYDPWIASPVFNSTSAVLVLPSAQAVTCIAIAAHNVATAGGIIRPFYSTDGGGSWNSVAPAMVPTDNSAIMWLFSGAPAATHWRISVFGQGSSNVEIGVAFVGNPLVIDQRIYQGYAPPITPNNVDLQSNVSEGGNLLGSSTVRKGSSASASLTHINPSFLRASTWTGFQNHFNNGGGFFWAWRPTKYGDVFYSWREGAVIAPTNSGPKDYMSFDLNMRMYDQP